MRKKDKQASSSESDDLWTWRIDKTLKAFLIQYVDEISLLACHKNDNNWSYSVTCQVNTEDNPVMSFNFPSIDFNKVKLSIHDLKSMPESTIIEEDFPEDGDEVHLKFEIADKKANPLSRLFAGN